MDSSGPAGPVQMPVYMVAPYYNKPTQEGLYLHHKMIAEAVDIPQILYNVPGRTACDMLPDNRCPFCLKSPILLALKMLLVTWVELAS